MSVLQILSATAVLVVAVLTYFPWLLHIRLPSAKKPPLLKEVEDVVRIRDSHNNTEITNACNALLHVLLGVQ